MLQAIMQKPEEIEFRDVALPQIKDTEVLIKVMSIGVCGSDIHVYHGKHPYTSYPVVQGHEMAGVIAEVGKDVVELKRGDKVTIMPQVVCGECYSCKSGNYNICDDLKVMGFQTTGCASEYFAIAADMVLKIPSSVGYQEGAMIEPLAVAVHALRRYGDITGQNILVLGAGPIGNLVAQAAKGLGASKVMITDVSEFRLDMAKKCGIDVCIDGSKADLNSELIKNFGTNKADLILECVGINATIAQAVGCARKGSDIIVVGVFGDKASVDLGLVQDRELRLIGTLMYKKEDYMTAISLIEAGKVILEPLITDVFLFRDYIKAYEHIGEKKDHAMKVIIHVGE